MVGLDGFDHEAETQARFFETKIPVYARLLRQIVELLRADTAIARRVAEVWAARDFQAVYERPLLFCAALRFDALTSTAHPLAPAIGGGDPPLLEQVTPQALTRALALRDDAPIWHALRARYVQTNEVTRAIAWRYPLGLLPPNEPVILVDLGCSAGLNLIADRLELQWIDEASGAPLVLAKAANIRGRVGFDRAPISPRDPAECDWLRACLWPGQTARMIRLDAAIAAARVALERGEVTLITASALEMPAHLDVLANANPDARILAYHTIFTEYLTPADRDAFERGMHRWLTTYPTRATWISFETAAHHDRHPVELRARVASAESHLASADYHPSSLFVV